MTTDKKKQQQMNIVSTRCEAGQFAERQEVEIDQDMQKNMKHVDADREKRSTRYEYVCRTGKILTER